MLKTPISLQLITLAALASGSALSQNVNNSSEKEILDARAAWNKAMANHDADAISDLVTPDFYSVNASRQLRGMTAVKDSYASLFKRRPDLAYSRTPDRVAVMEAWGVASEQGTWTERWSAKDGVTELRGTYLVMWRLLNGKWKQEGETFVPDTCKGHSYRRPDDALAVKDASNDTLGTLAGWYEMSDGSVLEVRRDGKTLVAQGSVCTNCVLVSKSDREFSARGSVIRFSRAETNTSTLSVEVSQGGKRISEGRKLMPATQSR